METNGKSVYVKTDKRDLMIMKWHGGNATEWIYANTCCWQILVGWCTMHTVEARLRKGHKIAFTYGTRGGVNHLDWLATRHIFTNQTKQPPQTPSDTLSCSCDHLTHAVVFIHAEDGQKAARVFLKKDLSQSEGTRTSEERVTFQPPGFFIYIIYG